MFHNIIASGKSQNGTLISKLENIDNSVKQHVSLKK